MYVGIAAIASVTIVRTSACLPVENTSATRASAAPIAHTMSTVRCHENSSTGGGDPAGAHRADRHRGGDGGDGQQEHGPTMAPSWIWAASPTQPSAAQIDQDARLEPSGPATRADDVVDARDDQEDDPDDRQHQRDPPEPLLGQPRGDHGVSRSGRRSRR
jgi:hypothetical protein